MARTFPLLKLPLLTQQQVIRTMDCHSTITFSMGYQKMKYLVRRLNFRAKCFRTYVGNNEIRVTSVEAGIDVRFRLEENEPNSFRPLGMLGDCKARKLRDWMEILKYIYSCDRYGLLFFDGCEQFRVNFLREEFEQLEHEEIRFIKASNAYAIEVLHIFVPVKQLMINKDPFPTRDGLEVIICRPFDTLVLHQIPTTVIELININAIDIECWKCHITEEDLNLFFRLWIHGEYPRLSSMYLKIVKADFDEIQVFEEMEYEVEKKPDDEVFRKVYWIKSLDGKKASVRFNEWGELTDVYFKVQK